MSHRSPLSLVLALLAGIVACGGNDCPVLIYYIIDGGPTYLAYRNGSDAWQVPKIDSDGTYHMCVDTSIEVVSVCEQDSGGFVAEEFLALSSEQSEIDGPPCNPVGSGSSVTVSGSVTVPGTIGIYESSDSNIGTPWEYSVQVPAGTYDIVASSSVDGGSGSVDIVRAQTFLKDSTVNVDPTIGTPLTSEVIDVDGLGSDDAVSVVTTYYTQTTEVPISIELGPTVLAVPASAIPSGDTQFISIDASGSEGDIGTDQAIEAEFATGSATESFAVLETLDGAALQTTSPLGAMWSELPGFSDLELELVSPPGQGSGSGIQSLQRVLMSSNYQLTLQPKGITFDTSSPGYQPKWEITPADPFAIALVVTLDSITETLSTSISQVVTPAAAAPLVAPGRRPVLPRPPRGRL